MKQLLITFQDMVTTILPLFTRLSTLTSTKCTETGSRTYTTMELVLIMTNTVQDTSMDTILETTMIDM